MLDVTSQDTKENCIILLEDNKKKIVAFNDMHFQETFIFNQNKKIELYCKKIASTLDIDFNKLILIDLINKSNYNIQSFFHTLSPDNCLIIYTNHHPVLVIYDDSNNSYITLNIDMKNFQTQNIHQIIKDALRENLINVNLKALFFNMSNQQSFYFSYREYNNFINKDPDSYQFFNIREENDFFKFNIIKYLEFLLYSLGVNDIHIMEDNLCKKQHNFFCILSK